MSGPIEVGQVWYSAMTPSMRRVITHVNHGKHGLMGHAPKARPSETVFQYPDEFLLDWRPTIPLRIRVGVTADGTWLAEGDGRPGMTEGVDRRIAFMLGRGAPVVAWHWITAEVPMPESEQGDVVGEVEQPCAGMPSDQKVQP